MSFIHVYHLSSHNAKPDVIEHSWCSSCKLVDKNKRKIIIYLI